MPCPCERLRDRQGAGRLIPCLLKPPAEYFRGSLGLYVWNGKANDISFKEETTCVYSSSSPRSLWGSACGAAAGVAMPTETAEAAGTRSLRRQLLPASSPSTSSRLTVRNLSYRIPRLCRRGRWSYGTTWIALPITEGWQRLRSAALP